jgi:hypothetical protein
VTHNTNDTQHKEAYQTSIHTSEPLQNFEKSLFKDFIACQQKKIRKNLRNQ